MLFPYTYGSSLEKSIEKLKHYVSDEPEILKEVDDAGYEHNVNNVERLIKSYNLLYFEQLAGPDDQTAIITFYRMKWGEFKGKLKLTLDEKGLAFEDIKIIRAQKK